MICDDCIKKNVCKLKERCNVLENDIAYSKIDDSISLEVKCKYRETRTGSIFKTPSLPYTPPPNKTTKWDRTTGVNEMAYQPE